MTKLTYTRNEVEELMQLEAKFERERIIKLLDSNDAWLAIDAQSVGEKENTVEGLIALIKGEN